MSYDRTQTLHGWAAYLDVYGLKALRQELGPLALSGQIAQCQAEVEARLSWSNREPIFYKFQDSLFLFYEVYVAVDADGRTTMQKCVGDIQEILSIFADARNTFARWDCLWGWVLQWVATLRACSRASNLL